MKKYEVVIEDTKDGNVNLISNIRSLKKARLAAMMYRSNYRVMINEIDEEYGICNNIYDNKSVIDALDEMQKELEELMSNDNWCTKKSNN